VSGHNKWSKIKNKKGATDAKRAKVFQKLSREIYVATKAGGPDPEANPSLRLVMDKAKAANMPNDNVNRAIEKGSSNNAGENYDEITYEGYGPGGIAILVETLTDNTNRTLTNVRTIFNKNSGSLAETGAVSYMFERQGYIAIEREGLDIDEDEMLMNVIEAGGEDMTTSDEVFEITTEASEFTSVRDNLEEQGFKLAQAEITMAANVMVELAEDKVSQLENLIDLLEDDDDVQNVHYNTELPDAE